jgi:hypothetical protein
MEDRARWLAPPRRLRVPARAGADLAERPVVRERAHRRPRRGPRRHRRRVVAGARRVRRGRRVRRCRRGRRRHRARRGIARGRRGGAARDARRARARPARGREARARRAGGRACSGRGLPGLAAARAAARRRLGRMAPARARVRARGRGLAAGVGRPARPLRRSQRLAVAPVALGRSDAGRRGGGPPRGDRDTQPRRPRARVVRRRVRRLPAGAAGAPCPLHAAARGRARGARRPLPEPGRRRAAPARAAVDVVDQGRPRATPLGCVYDDPR